MADKIVYFDYCAVVLVAVLMVSTLYRKMTKGRLNEFFIYMIGVQLISIAFDIMAINLDNLHVLHETSQRFAHTGYLLFHNMATPIYVLYLITFTDTWHNFKKSYLLKTIFCAPFIIVAALLAINFFSPVVFDITGQGQYIREEFFAMLYISTAIYTVLAAFYIIYARKLLSAKVIVALAAIFPMMLSAVFVQFFYQNYPIELFAQSVGMLMIFTTVQRPEDNYDSITGLGKLDYYVSSIHRNEYNKKTVYIIMINISNYSALSRVFGYDGMNTVLQQIAKYLTRLNEEWKTRAELFYLGDGKFRMVFEEGHFHEVDEVAEAILSSMKSDIATEDLQAELMPVICIAGMPDDILDAESILAFGNDLNKYKDRNEVLYAEDIFEQTHYDLMRDIDAIIENALAKNIFQVYYQPIFSLKQNKFNSAEALIRLQDEKYGFISPELFIRAAEKNGSIHKIGKFVLEEVCKFIASDEFKRLGLDYIEVNLSVKECMQTTLARDIISLLDQYDVKPGQINLEITETAASYSQQTMMDNLEQLTNYGVHFSLDDFGTGYSNMRRIASMPFSLIKLDKTFATMEENPKLEIVLKNTIRMIKDMNMEIVAEGIETDKLVKMYADMDCEYIQGYYYSRPLPKNDFVEFVEEKLG